jgi:hypothetical protein
MSRRAVFSCALLSLLVIAGCGGGGDGELTDEQKVVSVVSGFGDAASNPDSLKAVFVSSSVDPEEYKNLSIQPVSEPDIDGDTATIKVKVTTGMVDSSQGDSVTAPEHKTFEKEWSLQKVDGEWKLKDAPVKP